MMENLSLNRNLNLHFLLHSNFYGILLAGGDFCHLLITFANSSDPDQDRQDVGPDLDPNS